MAILLVVVLMCMLLVNLTQMSSLRARADELVKLIEEAKHDVQKQQELLEYMQSNEYVKEWAEQNDLISGEDVSWINGLSSQK